MFTGGAGADTFILGGHDGAETIANFSGTNGDVINLADIPIVQNLSDLSHYLTQDGSGNAVIDFSGVNGLSTKVTLQGVIENSLTAADFVFAQAVPADQTSTIITNSPIGTTFVESGANLLSNTNNTVLFASAPGAFGTLTQNLNANTTALALNQAADPYIVTSVSDGAVNTCLLYTSDAADE